MKYGIIIIGIGFLTAVLCFHCENKQPLQVIENKEPLLKEKKVDEKGQLAYLEVARDIPIKEYFQWMDSVLARLDTLLPFEINEYMLVRHNSWLVDTLACTDYYHLKSKGIISKDPQVLLALRKGQKLIIPSKKSAAILGKKIAGTRIDVNVPAFKLRVFEDDSLVAVFPVRVGKNEQKYLAMAGRIVDLKTQIGSGKIIRVNRNPSFINPANNHRYETTERDDGVRTKLPLVPWIEPEVNGIRYGQLIHPTTNLATLGKASSNGCIGMREGDMWRVYYFAPVGTPITIRYDLMDLNERGDSISVKDIYPQFKFASLNKAGMTNLSKKALKEGICTCLSIE